MPEVERLRAGYRSVGNWTLAQVCEHLAGSINGSIDGFDLRRHRIKRALFARPLLWYTFRFGIPSGYTVDPALTPPDDAGLDGAITGLREALARYQQHDGPLSPHPLFGKLSRAMWNRMQCFHCAHHLRFVWPSEPAPES